MFFRSSAGGASTSAMKADFELAHATLLILALTAMFVGSALGSLLPRPMAGVTLGSGAALLIATFLQREFERGSWQD